MDGDDSPGSLRHEARTVPRTVRISDDQPHPVDVDRLRHLADHVLAAQGVPAHVELSVACIDADEMAALKGQHLGEHVATDVLAFPMDAIDEWAGERGAGGDAGAPTMLGDVVLCPQVAAAQAADRDASTAEELDLLLVHGILHLLGYDHVDTTEREEMFGLTDTLLAAFGSSSA